MRKALLLLAVLGLAAPALFAKGAERSSDDEKAQIIKSVAQMGKNDERRVEATCMLAEIALKNGQQDKARALYARAVEFSEKYGYKGDATVSAYKGLLALMDEGDPRRPAAEARLAALAKAPAPAKAGGEAPNPFLDAPDAATAAPLAVPAPEPIHPTEAESAAAQASEENAPYEEPEAERLRRRISFSPVIYFDLVGGQYFFGGSRGSLAANSQLTVSGSLKKPGWDRWTFVPVYSTRYQGTKQVTDLVGGGTLFQETMEHRVAVRGIYELSDQWRLKPELGYKGSFLKETRDEKWGKGLFDYRRPGAAVEAEYLYRDPFSLRVSYDYYRLSFPNYISLESTVPGGSAAGLARELSGANVINSSNHGLTGSGSVEGPWRSLVEGSVGLTLRSFGEQHIVAADGSLASKTRSDQVAALSASWRFPRQLGSSAKVVAGVSAAYVKTFSNQNGYDAQQAVFLPDYYSARQHQLGASAVLSLDRESGPKPLTLSASVTYGHSRYPGRPSQSEAGTYGSQAVHTDELFLSGGLSWPIAERFSWTGTLQYARQSSNMQFEKLYAYNYHAVNYLMGFTWEY